MKITVKKAALALAIASAFGGANATLLPNLAPTSSVDQVAGFFGGVMLDSAITNIANTSYNGIARTAVYDSGSGLDFYYQFTNDSSSKNGLERFSAYDFSSLASSVINVYQTGTSFGIFSTGTESSDGADRTPFGVIGFSFIPNTNSKINPGTTSFTQIIRTNAHSYTAGNFGLLDGIGDNARAFAPVSSVPEPESFAMLLAGLGMIGTIARRRKAKHDA
jgi:PEP-CTERM motif